MFSHSIVSFEDRTAENSKLPNFKVRCIFTCPRERLSVFLPLSRKVTASKRNLPTSSAVEVCRVAVLSSGARRVALVLQGDGMSSG